MGCLITGLVPVIPLRWAKAHAFLSEMAGTSPAMTSQHKFLLNGRPSGRPFAL
jgi:hypothetical protein